MKTNSEHVCINLNTLEEFIYFRGGGGGGVKFGI